MKRVTVIGAPGTGKSALSLRLGEVTGLPVVHLDQHFWNPGWVGTPRDECRRIHAGLLAPDQWIVDGGYSNTLDDRVAVADTVIFLDLPCPVYLWRIVKRTLTTLGHVRPDLAPGCPERFDPDFVAYTWRFKHAQRPGVLAILDAAQHLLLLDHYQQILGIDAGAGRGGD